MKPFTSRYLLLAAFSLLLGACQSTPPAAPRLRIRGLRPSRSWNKTWPAANWPPPKTNWLHCRPNRPTTRHLRPTSVNWPKPTCSAARSCCKGDVNAAATALSRARALMPKAPALTGGVNSAISHARKAELDQAEAALKAAEAKPAAKVIDPAAPSTTVALNLADVEDMRHQLDAIATDVVNYQCDVSIQVPRTQDYPWLATLLTKRVKRIDSGYDLKIHRQILKHIPAQVVLIPRKAD